MTPLRGDSGRVNVGSMSAAHTHLIVAVGPAPRLLLDAHAGSSRNAVFGVRVGHTSRESASADLHAAVGYMLDFGFALCLVGGETGACRSMVCTVVIIVYTRVPGELIGAGETLLATREGALEGLLACVGANVTGLWGARDKREVRVKSRVAHVPGARDD